MSGSTEVVPNSWNGYANSSTVHGIKFTSEGFSRRRRLAWGVLLFTGLSVLFGFTVSTIVEYFQYKVNTIVTVGSERAAVFPAVTLCNLNALRPFPPVFNKKNPLFFTLGESLCDYFFVREIVPMDYDAPPVDAEAKVHGETVPTAGAASTGALAERQDPGAWYGEGSHADTAPRMTTDAILDLFT